MELKKLFGIVSVACLMFISCSEEIVVDEFETNTSFNITLTTSGVETKAATANSFATSEELKINNCAIAIFNTADKMVGFKYATFANGAPSATIDNKDLYKIEGITTQSGNVRILVVANPTTTEADLKGLFTYSAFKGQSVAYAAANQFKASSLIKFGEKAMELKPDNKDEIQIPLTQVAARVDVTYKMIFTETGWSGVINANTINDINVQSSIFLKDYTLDGYVFGSETEMQKTGVAVVDNKMSFYTYEKSSPIKIDVPVVLTYRSRTEKRTYNLSLSPVYVKDKCSTNGIVHGHYYEVTGNMNIDINLNCTVNWEVKAFTPVTVTIPDFD